MKLHLFHSRFVDRVLKTINLDSGLVCKANLSTKEAEQQSVVQVSKLDSHQHLCENCSQLSFSRFFSRPIEGVQFVANVGRRFRSRQDTDCSLCGILSHCRIDEPYSASTDNPDYDVLVAYPFFIEDCKIRASYSKLDGLILAIRHQSLYFKTEYTFSSLAYHILQNGCGLVTRALEDTSIVARHNPQFNARIALSWLQNCKDSHGLLCIQRQSFTGAISLIDCHTLAVGLHREDQPYIALSYVWGGSDIRGVRWHNRRLSLCLEQLPQVVRDAITVTLAMGFRYLWIDKYCIDQDEPLKRSQQIQQMDAIYANSEITIIAAAGDDENYGLPGVSTRQRTAQPTVRFGELNITWASRRPEQQVIASKWNTRGWTYQEGYLSRRRLIFLDEQVYFECSKGVFHESEHLPVEGYSPSSFEIALFSNPYIRTGAAGFCYAVEQYSARELSCDSDALRGFAGIIRSFSVNAQDPVWHVWGLPISMRNANISDELARSLSWPHDTPNVPGNTPEARRRRRGFPSWTWAGWTGKVHSNWISREDRLQLHLRINHLEDDRGKRIRLQDAVKPMLEESLCAFRILSVEALVVPMRLFKFNSASIPRWTFMGLAGNAYLSEGSEGERMLAEGLNGTDSWKCVLLSGSIGKGFCILVLMKDMNTGTWVRAGVFDITRSFKVEQDKIEWEKRKKTLHLETLKIA
ncbi:HET-domain-containing protein [Daldinia bambusicola]|nr:HET-domain-containing protein [Daldinia bambusicola]